MDNQFSYKKAAEKLGVSVEQLEKIVKAGKIIEADSGLIEGFSLDRWIYDRKEIDAEVYSLKADASRQFQSDGMYTRQRVTQEALEHFEKELKAFADAKWNEWEKGERKALEAEHAAIDGRRLEKLKNLGAL